MRTETLPPSPGLTSRISQQCSLITATRTHTHTHTHTHAHAHTHFRDFDTVAKHVWRSLAASEFLSVETT